MAKNTKKVWEKQTWETATSFKYFQKYFLLQNPPRLLTRAYRRYLIESRGRDPLEAEKLFPSGAWQLWSRCLDKNNQLVHPNALTWIERSDLYDQFIVDMSDETALDNRRELVEYEKKDAEKQLEFWTLLFNSFEDFIKYKIENAKNNNAVFDPIPYIVRSKELFKWREDIATFHRRSLLLPASIKGGRFDDEKDKPLKVNWQEPEFNNENIGVGAEEVIASYENGKSAN